jgi:hypothetical protein
MGGLRAAHAADSGLQGNAARVPFCGGDRVLAVGNYTGEGPGGASTPDLPTSGPCATARRFTSSSSRTPRCCGRPWVTSRHHLAAQTAAWSDATHRQRIDGRIRWH